MVPLQDYAKVAVLCQGIIWLMFLYGTSREICTRPGALPTNAISIEFEIQPKFAVLCFKNALYGSQRTFAHVTTVTLCKISLWSVE